MKTIAALEAWLGELHQRTRETPLFNPVFQLSLDLSRALEGGEISLDDMGALVTELKCEGLKARAGKLRRLLAPSSTAAPLAGDADISRPSARAGNARNCTPCSPRTRPSCVPRRRPKPQRARPRPRALSIMRFARYLRHAPP